MARAIEVRLEKRGVSCIAELLDDVAPRTCGLVWNSLPREAPAWHAKYASNEVYALMPPLDGESPGRENSTITPAAGDLVYLEFPVGQVPPKLQESLGFTEYDTFVDLALFYARNNLLLDPGSGWVPGNVFATVTENFDAIAEACQDVWRNGFEGERLSFKRVE